MSLAVRGARKGRRWLLICALVAVPVAVCVGCLLWLCEPWPPARRSDETVVTSAPASSSRLRRYSGRRATVASGMRRRFVPNAISNPGNSAVIRRMNSCKRPPAWGSCESVVKAAARSRSTFRVAAKLVSACAENRGVGRDGHLFAQQRSAP